MARSGRIGYDRQAIESKKTGGEGGIRTLGTGISQYNGLANGSFSPPSLVFKYLQSDGWPKCRIQCLSFGSYCAPLCAPQLLLEEEGLWEELMKVKLNRRERDSLLRQLRIAVAHQIELWDVTLAMAEQLGCELEEVTSGVQAASVTADTGLELGLRDLNEFLGVGVARQATGRRVTELRSVQ
jgi:hypothetical protein